MQRECWMGRQWPFCGRCLAVTWYVILQGSCQRYAPGTVGIGRECCHSDNCRCCCRDLGCCQSPKRRRRAIVLASHGPLAQGFQVVKESIAAYSTRLKGTVVRETAQAVRPTLPFPSKMMSGGMTVSVLEEILGGPILRGQVPSDFLVWNVWGPTRPRRRMCNEYR